MYTTENDKIDDWKGTGMDRFKLFYQFLPLLRIIWSLVSRRVTRRLTRPQTMFHLYCNVYLKYDENTTNLMDNESGLDWNGTQKNVNLIIFSTLLEEPGTALMIIQHFRRIRV